MPLLLFFSIPTAATIVHTIIILFLDHQSIFWLALFSPTHPILPYHFLTTTALWMYYFLTKSPTKFGGSLKFSVGHSEPSKVTLTFPNATFVSCKYHYPSCIPCLFPPQVCLRIIESQSWKVSTWVSVVLHFSFLILGRREMNLHRVKQKHQWRGGTWEKETETDGRSVWKNPQGLAPVTKPACSP